MAVTANLAALVLFVFYAVTFTKGPIGLLSSSPTTSNWIIRIWALVLGLAGAVGDYLMTASVVSRLGVYTELKLGAAAAVGAIVTYHIGSASFVDAFATTAEARVLLPATATMNVGPVLPPTSSIVLPADLTTGPLPV